MSTRQRLQTAPARRTFVSLGSARALTLLLFLALAPALRGEVLVVDDDGGAADHTDIQHAIDVAQDGDVILVRDGVYPDEILIDDLAVSIVAEGPTGGGQLRRRVTIQNLAPGKSVVLRGLEQGDLFVPFAADGLAVVSCQGVVRVEQCALLGKGSPFGGGNQGHAGVAVRFSDAVAFSRCSMRGGAGQYGSDEFGTWPGRGGPGLFARQSKVVLEDCTLTGGPGGQSAPLTDDDGYAGETGGPALEATASSVFVTGGTLTGGPGGHGAQSIDVVFGGTTCFDGGSGGPAVQVRNAAVVRSVGADLQGGPGGGATTEPDDCEGFPITIQATLRPAGGGLVQVGPVTTALLLDGSF